MNGAELIAAFRTLDNERKGTHAEILAISDRYQRNDTAIAHEQSSEEQRHTSTVVNAATVNSRLRKVEEIRPPIAATAKAARDHLVQHYRTLVSSMSATKQCNSGVLKVVTGWATRSRRGSPIFRMV